MHHTALHDALRVYFSDHLFKSFKAIHTKKQYIFNPSRLRSSNTKPQLRAPSWASIYNPNISRLN
jgi:hypothetical protein